MPSLGMMTINALVASDTVLIPVQAAYLSVKGLQQLIRISMVKKRLNRKLTIQSILLTMVDFRTNYAKDIAFRVRHTYGPQIKIFENVIPLSLKVAEASAEGKSIYQHCPNGKVAFAYENLTEEVLVNEESAMEIDIEKIHSFNSPRKDIVFWDLLMKGLSFIKYQEFHKLILSNSPNSSDLAAGLILQAFP